MRREREPVSLSQLTGEGEEWLKKDDAKNFGPLPIYFFYGRVFAELGVSYITISYIL